MMEIKTLDSKLVLAGVVSLTLLAMFIILPSVSFFYGSDRLFFQLLIFTAPIFIIGTFKIAEILNKVIKKPDLKVALVLVLLIFLFICNTHLQYELTGISFSPEYDKTGITRGELYIYDGELATAKWIGTYRADDINVYSDAVGFNRCLCQMLEQMLLELILTTKQLMVIFTWEMQMLKRVNFMIALIVRQMFKLIVLSLPIKVEYLMMDMDRYGLKKNNNKY
jgi:uncharacterized membrane protein